MLKDPYRGGLTVLSILWPCMTGIGYKAEVDNGVAYITETVGFHGKTRILLLCTITRGPCTATPALVNVMVFDLRQCNFQTSFHIRGNKMMKIRGDRNAKSLKLYYTNFKSFSNKSSRIFGFEKM